MATGVVETQGTKLYFVKPGETPTLVKLSCPSGINGVGAGARDNLVVDCLENTGDREARGGSSTPGQTSVPFTLVPGATSHQDLFELRKSRALLPWIVCLSDNGESEPTLDVGNTITPPTGGTSFEYDAYIADLSIEIASNALVTGTLTLQRSGEVTAHWPS